MKKLLSIALFFAFVIPVKSLKAQDSTIHPLNTYKVAIFTPLYLDSAFNGSFYRYGKQMPKFVMPGLEFAQGALIALDSMPVFNGNINATIFDSKAYNPSLNSLLSSTLLDSFNLIIGSVRDAEFTSLANFAKTKNIPFISATYPNDAGITDNPYLAIANPTLRAHCEAIFSYLLQMGASANIILARKNGAQEDKVEQYFKKSNAPDGKPLLSIKTVNIAEDFTQINYHLDSTKTNIIIGGSLNEAFASELAKQCSTINKLYPITLIGMPNWDGFRITNSSKDIKDFPVYYTTPYYNTNYDAVSRKIQSVYKKKYKSNPTDMVYKGYDVVFVYSRLLTRYPLNFMEHLNDYTYKVFSEYKFKPVSNNGSPIDYYENKRLYLLKVINGAETKAW